MLPQHHEENFPPAIENDAQRFAAIFHDFYHRLRDYAYDFLDDKDASEDIVQECFAKLWTKKTEINYCRPVGSYLYAMVRNRCFNHIRNRKVRKRNEYYYTLLPEESGLDRLIRTETYGELYAASCILPGKCRKIFRMILEGKNYTQIAVDMCISESTIRTQKARALTLLRKHLHNHPVISRLFL